MKRLSFKQANELAYKKYGYNLGMFSRVKNKTGVYYSYGLSKTITKEQLINESY